MLVNLTNQTDRLRRRASGRYIYPSAGGDTKKKVEDDPQQARAENSSPAAAATALAIECADWAALAPNRR